MAELNYGHLSQLSTCVKRPMQIIQEIWAAFGDFRGRFIGLRGYVASSCQRRAWLPKAPDQSATHATIAAMHGKFANLRFAHHFCITGSMCTADELARAKNVVTLAPPLGLSIGMSIFRRIVAV